MIYRGEAPTPELKALAYYLAIFFVGNCVKMKEIGPGSTPPWLPLPGSANELPKIGIMSNQIHASKMPGSRNFCDDLILSVSCEDGGMPNCET